MRRSATVVHLLLASLLLPAAPPAGAQEISDLDLYLRSLRVAQHAMDHFGEVDDPEELDRIATIGYQLVRESGFDRFPVTFYLIDIPVPNAFALPGGQIFVTRGMLELDLTDDMMAGLLGHELAHVVFEHGIRMQRRATLLNILSTAALVGVLIASGRGGRDSGPQTPYDPYGHRAEDRRIGNRIEGTAAAGLLISELLLRNYSREFEDEADREGQRWAAAAGFAPEGTQELWARFDASFPQRSREYGYWRTHPFSDERARAARVRAQQLMMRDQRDASEVRRKTQSVLVQVRDRSSLDPQLEPLVEQAILAAWPQGRHADRIRLERLRELRSKAMEAPATSRDYGRLLAAYQEQRRIVAERDPESPLIATLDEEIGELRRQLADLYPQAVELLRQGTYQTGFLESFLSNFPEAPEVSQAALALGDAYSRLGRESDAVAVYLKAWEAAPGSEAGRRARAGLRNLAPRLDRLAALQHLAAQEEDEELRELAETRLDRLASTYRDLANGAEYLRRFPGAEHAERVNQRLNSLAQNLYGEMILYQEVGDSVKALDRIHQILTYAPLSPAADQLRERAVLEG